MTDPVTLRGITWSHDRGFLPLVATAARFSQEHPTVRIVWEKRTLKEFEEYPVERLAPDFDLIVLDHPFVGHAAAHGLVLPLDEHLPADFLAEQAAYCPFAYGYSNYARDHYAPHRLTFGEPPSFGGKPLCSTLGGTGLAVSALRPRHAEALAYARFVASPEVQRGLYATSGGQPGLRIAWTDPANNRLAHDYFARTLPVLERAYVRPRYFGHLDFQRSAGPVVQAALRRALPDDAALTRLNDLYRDSLRNAPCLA